MANKKSSEMTDVLKQGVLGEKASKKPVSSQSGASVASSGSLRYALERFWGKVLRLDAPVWVRPEIGARSSRLPKCHMTNSVEIHNGSFAFSVSSSKNHSIGPRFRPMCSTYI